MPWLTLHYFLTVYARLHTHTRTLLRRERARKAKQCTMPAHSILREENTERDVMYNACSLHPILKNPAPKQGAPGRRSFLTLCCGVLELYTASRSSRGRGSMSHAYMYTISGPCLTIMRLARFAGGGARSCIPARRTSRGVLGTQPANSRRGSFWQSKYTGQWWSPFGAS